MHNCHKIMRKFIHIEPNNNWFLWGLNEISHYEWFVNCKQTFCSLLEYVVGATVDSWTNVQYSLFAHSAIVVRHIGGQAIEFNIREQNCLFVFFIEFIFGCSTCCSSNMHKDKYLFMMKTCVYVYADNDTKKILYCQ